MSGIDQGLRGRVLALRAEIAHPIIDADGHVVEFLPDLMGYLRRAGIEEDVVHLCAQAVWGPSYSADWSKLSPAERARIRSPRPSSDDFAPNLLDRATTMLPDLLYSRLDEIGIDFAVVYPSVGNFLSIISDERTRRAACHAYNDYTADLFTDFSDRITVPAVVPMHTPAEAIAELEHAHELGAKVALIPAFARRFSDDVPHELWFDGFGLDSLYDYDPVWARCGEYGLPVSSHGAGYGEGWLNRQSVSNFSFNHMGHFAAAQEFLCRSLFMGGVTHRFPGQRFSFLEGGVSWAATLYSSAISHWEKRNGAALRTHLRQGEVSDEDRAAFRSLVEARGGKILQRSGDLVLDRIDDWLWSGAGGLPDEDEWAQVGIATKADFIERFVVPFAFGAEADDPMTMTAFTPANPLGARLNVLFSSDMGHFDVPDLLGILSEAHEGVDDGWMTPGDFRDFTFANAARFFTDMNPDFFAGTAVEAAVADLR